MLNEKYFVTSEDKNNLLGMMKHFRESHNNICKVRHQHIFQYVIQ